MYINSVRLAIGPFVNEISVKDARDNFKDVLERVAAGEEVIIVRHGKPVAKLVLPVSERPRLPDLSAFRASIPVTGAPASQLLVEERDKDRS